MCCKLKPECGNFWYDLGLSYQHLAASDTPNETSLLVVKSKDCFIQAVNLEPENPIFWNTLGIHYSSNGRLRHDTTRHALKRKYPNEKFFLNLL